jgi:hypothetical protein
MQSEDSESNSTDPLAICLSAIARRSLTEGVPLSHDEVVYYFELLNNKDSVPDPFVVVYDYEYRDDMFVSKEARRTLRECGGDELAKFLQAKFFDSLSNRTYYVEFAGDLLGVCHPFVQSLLHHPEPEIRKLTLRALWKHDWTAEEYKNGIAPLLVDPDDEVLAEVLAIVWRPIRYECLSLPAGPFPPENPCCQTATACDVMQQATELLKRSNPATRNLRLQAFSILAVLTESWQELANVASGCTLDELRWLVVENVYFHGKELASLLRADPTLRNSLKQSIVGRFRFRTLWSEKSMLEKVCFFAPDPEAFEIVITQLSRDSGSLEDLSQFTRIDPSLMPTILDAVFGKPNRVSKDPSGLIALLQSNPDAFAAAMRSSPFLESRLQIFEEVVGKLQSTETIEKLRAVLHEQLASALDALKPKPKRKRRR